MERNTASQFCGSPEDTQILAEVAKEKPGEQDLPGVGARWVRSTVSHARELPDPLRA